MESFELPAPSQASILVLQKTISEQDRRLLLLGTSVLRQQQGVRLSLPERAPGDVPRHGAGGTWGCI